MSRDRITKFASVLPSEHHPRVHYIVFDVVCMFTKGRPMDHWAGIDPRPIAHRADTQLLDHAFSFQGRNKLVENVQGSRRSRGFPTKVLHLVWRPLTVPCPWVPEGLATTVCLSKCLSDNDNENFTTLVHIYKYGPRRYKYK